MSKPPVFPEAPKAYDPQAFNAFLRILTMYLTQTGAAVNTMYIGKVGVLWTSGTGSPEGVVAAQIGSLYSRTDGGATTSLYVKTSGTGNTGWTAK
jgi:hypothetical protein